MKALSIMQPWAHFVVVGLKDIENRSWRTTFTGPILVHAGKRFDHAGHIWLMNNWHRAGLPPAVGDVLDNMTAADFLRGGIVGRVDITGCCSEHPSPWKDPDLWGFTLANAQMLPFTPLRGALGFFDVPDAIAEGAQ